MKKLKERNAKYFNLRSHSKKVAEPRFNTRPSQDAGKGDTPALSMRDQFGAAILGDIQLLSGVRCVSHLHTTVQLLHIPGKHQAGSQQERDTNVHEVQILAFTIRGLDK